MKSYYFMINMVVLVLAACDKGIGLPENTGNDEHKTTLTFEEFRSLRALEPEFRLSEDQAKERAMDFMDLFEQEQTKGVNFKKRQVEEIISVSGNGTLFETRSVPDDDSLGFYAVNFADSMGYVLVPSDKRVLDNVLAFSDEGNVSFEDGNPGMALFVGRLKNYQQQEIEKTMWLGDSLGAKAMEKLSVEQMPQTRVRPAGTAFTIDVPDSRLYMENIAQVRPMLKTKWGQWAPYNMNVPKSDCPENYLGNAPAGCVPVAVGQIMAYHKWPAGNGGDVIYNWDAMLAGNPVELASFIAYLGSDRYAGHTQPGMTTSYGCDGSNTTYGNHFDFLGQNNYTYKGTYSYDYNTVCWSIDTNCPLYARGEDGKDGHAWVIDGYVSLASKSKSCVLTACFNYEGYFIGYDGGPHSCVTKEFPNENKYYVHCNWGWNGSCNGYFLSGVFDADQVKLPSDYPDNLTRGYVFDSGLKLSPSIKPNR